MSILQKYITQEVLKIFFLSIGAFAFIYLIIDFLENIDHFVREDIPLSTTLEIFILKIPLILVQVAPIATLLSSLIALGILSKNSEIIAMMASGIHLFKIVSPVIVIALLVSIGSFFANESILPYTNQKAKDMKIAKLKKSSPLSSFKQNKIWYRSNNAIYNIDLLEPAKNTLKGVTIYYFDKNFRLIRRIDAKKAEWINKKWYFHDISSRTFDDRSQISMEKWNTRILPLQEVFDDFKVAERNSDEMSYTALRSYIKKIEGEGYDATRYEVDLHAKLAFPFVNLIMPLLGIPFALKTGRKKGIISGVGISMLIGFCYWVVLSICISLGHSGVMSPLVSAWISNLTFLFVGLFMLLNVR